jgi:hypothetical protein
MSKPIDVKDFGPDALAALAALQAANPNLDAAQIQAAFEAAIAASEPIDVNVVGGSAVTFATKTQNVPGNGTVTQLTALATANGALIRASGDMMVFNSATPAATDGFLVYEGDDIRMTTVANLDEVFVEPVKNPAIDVWSMTL